MADQYEAVRELVRQLTKPQAQKLEMLMGVVQSVETDTCTVLLPGAPAGIPGFRWLLDAYSPVEGHTVVILKNGPDTVIIGRVQS